VLAAIYSPDRFGQTILRLKWIVAYSADIPVLRKAETHRVVWV